MELYFYKCIKPNFGDELNAWMWPKLIDGVWGNDDELFLGIGSILFDFFPKERRKIVFGAGYGGYTPLPTLDDKWKIYFVRGKLTAKALGIDEKLGIGDAAILLKSCVNKQVVKRHKISFMPHWQSTFEGNWELACKLASINYIDPCAPVEVVLDNILASELVITEAMHGAIVADALRVPWMPVQPLRENHSMKWYDWASALDIDLKPKQLVSSSFFESLTLYLDVKKPSIAAKVRRRGKFLLNVAPSIFAQRAADNLIQISRNDPCLSSDTSIEESHEKMLSKVDELLKDLSKDKTEY
jgi:succinoglycan biosynthesis protein ExoV